MHIDKQPSYNAERTHSVKEIFV